MFKEKIKNMLTVKEGQGGEKKKIENLVVFVVILIITIISINFIWKDGKSKASNTKDNNINTETTYKKLATTEEIENKIGLEAKLENILSKIEGVGDVNVLITYSQNSELVPMYNETSKTSTTIENDSEGGERNIEQIDSTKEIIYKDENGESIPVTKTIIEPKIEGAIITAGGAGNPTVKTNIIQAVEAVTGVATHKIQVFEKKK